MLVRTVSASFTRPANTTAYASGDLVANSTTAASVQPLVFNDGARDRNAFGMVRRARIKKSGTTTSNASFRVHLYGSDPSASSGIANGDNSAWSTKHASYLGSIDVTVDKAFSDAAAGTGVPLSGSEINYAVEDGFLYALLEARAAYTPASGEVFTLEIEIVTRV